MQVIAGAAVISMMLAVPAQIYGSAPQGTSAAAKTEDGKENSSFEEAVEAFYQNSGSITDEQILASARDIVSDTDAMESALKADERESAAKALFGFEEAKASYQMAEQRRLEAEHAKLVADCRIEPGCGLPGVGPAG